MRAAMQIFITVLLMQTSLSATAQTMTCDTEYTIKRGDTLSEIADRTYGRPTAYQTIFDYNPGVLKSPSIIPVGVEIFIPCLGDQSQTAVTDLPALRRPEQADALGFKVLTGAEYPPYVDAGLPNGGFSFELVERALQFDDRPADYRIDVINDWSSHLEPLLSDGAYQLGFPWFKPDCSQADQLGEASRWRCDNLRFSEPLHEVVVTFFARAQDAPGLSSITTMQGKRLCRPRGYFTHDLESMGLVPPAIVRVAGDNPKDCFERLLDGEVDIVTVNADTSDSIIAELDSRDQLAELIDFATVQTLHVVGMKTDPQTRVRLLRFNKGLLGLRKSGAYIEIAKRHLRN